MRTSEDSSSAINTLTQDGDENNGNKAENNDDDKPLPAGVIAVVVLSSILGFVCFIWLCYFGCNYYAGHLDETYGKEQVVMETIAKQSTDAHEPSADDFNQQTEGADEAGAENEEDSHEQNMENEDLYSTQPDVEIHFDDEEQQEKI